jgi:hypothetical protein
MFRPGHTASLARRTPNSISPGIHHHIEPTWVLRASICMSRACAIELSACPCIRSVSILQATIFLQRMALALSLLSVASTPFAMGLAETTAPLSVMTLSVGPLLASPALLVFKGGDEPVSKYPGFGGCPALCKPRERQGRTVRKILTEHWAIGAPRD